MILDDDNDGLDIYYFVLLGDRVHGPYHDLGGACDAQRRLGDGARRVLATDRYDAYRRYLQPRKDSP